MWVTDILIIIPVVSNPLCDLIHICGSPSTCKKRPLLCMYWHLQLARWPANLSHEGDVQVELADVDHKLRSIYCNSGPKSVLYLRRWHCFDSFQIVLTYPIRTPQCKEWQKLSSLLEVRGSSETTDLGSFCSLQLMTRFPICKPECKEQKLFRNHWGAHIYFKRVSSHCDGAGRWNVRSMLFRRHKLQNVFGQFSG